MRNSVVAAQFDQWLFTSPIPLHSWTPVHCAALFAILVGSDQDASLPFRVVYFGETETLAEPAFFRSHPGYGDWVREAGSEAELYVSTYLYAGMSPQYREFVTDMLIREYQPVCNKALLR